MRRVVWSALLASLSVGVTAMLTFERATAKSIPQTTVAAPESPAPGPARRPQKTTTTSGIQAQAERLARITGAKSWGYQLNGMSVETAAASPYDLLVVDATTGLASGKPFTRAEVERLKRKPDGSRRIVVSYCRWARPRITGRTISRSEYMTEDAPDWLLHENKDWKGNRLIRFCNQGWQLTILGDEDGRNVYNSIDPSPLYRLIELGFDGIYLDRVDVYSEITKECPDGARKMVEFISRLGAHARKRDPQFMVILQNAEELLEHKAMMQTIDAVAKEGLVPRLGRR